MFQDIRRRIVQKRLKGWKVGALLKDILYGFFTLLKYKANAYEILTVHILYYWSTLQLLHFLIVV